MNLVPFTVDIVPLRPFLVRRPITLFVLGSKLLQPLFGIVDSQHVAPHHRQASPELASGTSPQLDKFAATQTCDLHSSLGRLVHGGRGGEHFPPEVCGSSAPGVDVRRPFPHQLAGNIRPTNVCLPRWLALTSIRAQGRPKIWRRRFLELLTPKSEQLGALLLAQMPAIQRRLLAIVAGYRRSPASNCHHAAGRRPWGTMRGSGRGYEFEVCPVFFLVAKVSAQRSSARTTKSSPARGSAGHGGDGGWGSVSGTIASPSVARPTHRSSSPH